MIPLSDLVTLVLLNRGMESSIQIPLLAARVEPVMLWIETLLQSPPELYHMFTPLVTRLPICAPLTIGDEKSPAEMPMPYLHDWDAVSYTHLTLPTKA